MILRLCSMAMVCLLLSPHSSIAQDQPQDFSRNAIYVEGLGQGILYSINYDYRFTTDAGIRIGFTRWSTGGDWVMLFQSNMLFTAFPITINFLPGESSSSFELGIGLMPMIASSKGQEQDETTVIGIATFGYRYQPIEGGIVSRIGFTPVFGSWGFLPTVGISLGYAF